MATQSVETASGPRRPLAETGGARALKGNYYERHIWSTLFYTNTNVCTKQLESKKGKHMQIYSNLRQKSTFKSRTTHTLHAITQKHTQKCEAFRLHTANPAVGQSRQDTRDKMRVFRVRAVQRNCIVYHPWQQLEPDPLPNANRKTKFMTEPWQQNNKTSPIHFCVNSGFPLNHLSANKYT